MTDMEAAWLITGCGQLEDHAGIARAGARLGGIWAARSGSGTRRRGAACCSTGRPRTPSSTAAARQALAAAGFTVPGMTVPRPELYAQSCGAPAGSAGPRMEGNHAGVASRASWRRQCGEGQRAAGECPGPGAGHEDSRLAARGTSPAQPARNALRTPQAGCWPASATLRAGLATEAVR